MFVTILKLVRTTLLVCIVLFGGCVHCLWTNYKNTEPNPCETVGQRMGLTDIHQWAEQGNGYGARCSGVRNGRYVQFRARSRHEW